VCKRGNGQSDFKVLRVEGGVGNGVESVLVLRRGGGGEGGGGGGGGARGVQGGGGWGGGKCGVLFCISGGSDVPRWGGHGMSTTGGRGGQGGPGEGMRGERDRGGRLG